MASPFDLGVGMPHPSITIRTVFWSAFVMLQCYKSTTSQLSSSRAYSVKYAFKSNPGMLGNFCVPPHQRVIAPQEACSTRKNLDFASVRLRSGFEAKRVLKLHLADDSFMQKFGQLAQLALSKLGRLQLRHLSIGRPSVAALCDRWRNDRLLSTSTDAPSPQSHSQVQEYQEPFRKTLKDRKRAFKQAETNATEAQTRGDSENEFEDWRLTVGLEIHAQLNTARKLFSGTSRSHNKGNIADN